MRFILVNLGSSDIVRMMKSLWTTSLSIVLSFQILGISSQGNILSPVINLLFRITLDGTPFSTFTDILAIILTIIFFGLKVLLFVPFIIYTFLKICDTLTDVIWGRLRL